jgi:glycine dehydrogenase subunit 1
MRYHPHTPDDVKAMLQAIGRDSVDALFSSIPVELRLNRPLRLPDALDEASLLAELEAMAARNDARAPFLGAGAYPHHVPAIVDQLLLRSEFYTAYTPYQPEVSQGTLQVIFEFQTLVAQLSGAEVANASMYDGASAAAEAALMALRIGKGRRRIVVGRNLHPEYRKVVRTYLANVGAEVTEVGYGADGRLDPAALRAALDEGAAAVLCGYPNFFGVVEDLPAVAAATHAKGALVVTCTQESVALGLLQPPCALGADIAVGEMQSFGNGLSFGGPGLGFFATRDEFVRQMPGRLAGVTVDKNGKRGFVLTLSTREQHIRREKATSNICTNNGLNALAASIHLALLGKHGLKELSLLNYRRARYLREKLAERGLKPAFTGPVFNEFAVTVPDAEGAFRRARARGLTAGLRLGREFPELPNALLLCATELHSRESIDLLVDALASSA